MVTLHSTAASVCHKMIMYCYNMITILARIAIETSKSFFMLIMLVV